MTGNIIEGAGIEKEPDPAIEVEKKKRELMGSLEIIGDVVSRAEVANEELRKSLESLRVFREQVYQEVLKSLQEEDKEGALNVIKVSDTKAELVRQKATAIESLMDEYVKATSELRGIIQSDVERTYQKAA